MKLILQRFNDNGNSTLGLLFFLKDDGTRRFLSFTLEDEYRAVKIKGETRIPAGIYPLKIRKENTELTVKHRVSYGTWFKFHIEITGIPNFSGVYIHAGNSEKHTDGCLLTGDTCMNNEVYTQNNLSNSIDSLKRVYGLIYSELDKGTKIDIEIRDEKDLRI